MEQTKKILWNLLLLTVGSVLCAVAIKGVLVPKQFLAGGITGVSLLIHYLFTSFPVGLIYLIINIPLFAIGWMFVGLRFFFYSLAGTVIFSIVMLCPLPVLPLEDS